MAYIRSITGCVRLELTAADIPTVLDAAVKADIPLYDTEYVNEFCVILCIRKKHWPRLKELCDNKGVAIKLKRRVGLYWSAKTLTRRPVLLVGAVLLFMFLITVPGRILFVCVEGNQTVPDNRILESAANFGLHFGANRRSLRSEQLKNQLLEEIPELRWAGVNTRGCVAVISVSERAEVSLPDREYSGISSIVASRDGVITSATATAGSLQCREGQAVKAGQVLISGYTDCGLCIRGGNAEGEIFAQTNRTLTVKIPTSYCRKGTESDLRRSISVIFGKKRINLWKDSGISDTVCDRMYSEYYITLPGGFQLPMCIAVETFRHYTCSAAAADEAQLRSVLESSAESYLSQDMIAGRIVQKREHLIKGDGYCSLDGRYVCMEMIGIVRQEQIGEYNGKDS